MNSSNANNKWASHIALRPGTMIAFLLCFSIFLAEPASAAAQINQWVYQVLQKAQQKVDEKRYDDAVEILNQLQKRRLSSYEKAQVLSVQGFIESQRQNYGQALLSYREILEIPHLPTGLVVNSLRVLVQLSLISEDYKQAVNYADRLLATSKEEDLEIYVMKAQAYFRLEKYDSALSALNTAIERKKAKGETPAENWLLLLNAIYHYQNNFTAMINVLQTLIDHYPKEKYIYNLAAVYAQLDQTKMQLLLMEPLYDSGFLNQSSQLMNLASLYINHGVPEKAARILEKGFKDKIIDVNKRNLEILAQAWVLAKEPERAIEPLSSAAKLSRDGNAYLRLAQTHISLSNWEQAEKALETALQLKSLDNPGNALILLGMTRYNQKSLSSAIDAFRQACKFDDVASTCEQWLTFLRQEQEKQALLGS